MPLSAKVFIPKAYQKLYKHFGPQHWWPGDTSFEIIVGAILTQNTNWDNVAKAIVRLKKHKLLTPKALLTVSQKKLAAHIKSSGYFNVKAKRLKNFIHFLYKEYGGNLTKMKNEEASVLRRKLLDVNGIGPETADSILLYALDKPAFVVDAYTKRILLRHGIVDSSATYYEMQLLFLHSLRKGRKLFNEYHALIVRTGKDYCKPKPLCGKCPLNNLSFSANQIKKFAHQ